METQINEAVTIALTPGADPAIQQQAIEFINSVKSTKDGYLLCVNIFSTNYTVINDEFVFFLLQVIDEFISKLSDEESYELDRKLFQVVRDTLGKKQHLVFIRNKLAAVFAKLFCKNYVNVNTNFLTEWEELAASSEEALDLFLRLSLAIHAEIGDKLILRSSFVDERNQVLKDTIRSRDMSRLVECWFGILAKNGNPLALEVIGQYVSWMEITLFISKDRIDLITNTLITSTSITACTTIIEIISKKMNSTKKLELLTLLQLDVLLAKLPPEDNLEFLENLAKLIDAIGLELCGIIDHDKPLLKLTLPFFAVYWPYALDFLGHEYDEISSACFGFITKYLLLARKNPDLINRQLLALLFEKLILKMKYDEDTQLSDDDLIAEFKEFRSKLKYFEDTIAALIPDLYIELVPKIISESLQATSWIEVELGLFQLVCFHDTIKNQIIPKDAMNLIVEFGTRLVNTPFELFQHELVRINFFETILRLIPSISPDGQFMYRVIEAYLVLGLLHDDTRIKYRSWYLFFRTMKLVQPLMLDNQQILGELVSKLVPQIRIVAPPINSDEEDLAFSSQLYLYEALGLLISIHKINDNSKLEFIDIVLQPVFDLLQNPSQPVLVHHAFMALGTFARGYHAENKNEYSEGVMAKFRNCAEVVLIVLGAYSGHQIVRESARFAFARFISVLTHQIVPQLNKLVLLLVESNMEMVELVDFLLFINQIVHIFQNNENIYNLLNSLITPLFNKVVNTLKMGGDTEESIRDSILLKKTMLTFISTIILNHQTSLLTTQTNKPLLPTIIDNILSICYEINKVTATEIDYSVNKLAITQIMNLISVFKNGKINDPQDTYSLNSFEPIEGIDDYLVSNAIRLSFDLPFKLGDISADNRGVIQELALLLKSLTANELFATKFGLFLDENGINEQIKQDLLQNLNQNDAKAFKKYFTAFIIELKRR